MSNLAPAGSSTYSSDTLHVGDGTWDQGRDDFLLPPLVGLNFATMQYNGMGNRFRNLPGYKSLVTAHGALAAITFLAVIPTAIFVAKFYRSNPRLAVKLHVYLQILTVFLLTVVFALGWFAVGPERSLTNPHHGIGLAIYVCVLVQFIYGWLMAKLEKRRKNPMALTRTPTKVWLHKLFGRTIALLGIVQIPLGLTLYGSPKVLFILYALFVAFLLFLYLALDRYYFEKRPVEFGFGGEGSEFYSDYNSSYLSGSRVDSRPGGRGARPPSREREKSHWGRNVLAGAGALGAYEAWKHRRSAKREEREQEEMDRERRHHRPPPQMGPLAPSGAPSSRPSSRPPPGVVYGAGGVPVFGEAARRTPTRVRREEDESRLSTETWEDEKHSGRPQRQNSWRDRLLGAGAGIGAFEGARRLFSRRNKRDDDYVEDDDYRRPLGGNQNMVSETDVSRVEAGHAPMSPDDPRNRQQRVNMAGVQPMTPTATPSRPPRNPRSRSSIDSLSYSESESVIHHDRPQHLAEPGDREDEGHTLRNSVATLGAIAGFREWNKHRKERRERQRTDKLRNEELEEEMYNRRNSNTYPRPQDSYGGMRRPSTSGTLLTGTSVAPFGDPGFGGSNPELAGHRMRPHGNERPVDTMHPPLPATAGTLPPSNAGLPPSTVGPSVSQPRFNEIPQGQQQGHRLPGPPPGPPPHGVRPPMDYRPPEPGSLQMPQGNVNPDPSRLMSSENVAQSSSQGHPVQDSGSGALFGSAAADLASERRRRQSQSESSSRYHSRQDSRTRTQRPERRGSTTSASASQLNTNVPPAEGGPGSPPVSVKVKMHNDGRHVTLRRLNEQEAEAERAARRAERRQRRRRSSEVSSGLENDGGNAPPVSNARYRRPGGIMRRNSRDQPITNVPPPPTMSSTSHIGSHRPPSELNLPPSNPPPPRVPQHSASPQDGDGLSPPAAPFAGSGMSGSPGDGGTGTDVSAFDNNRRRRRAERARRLEAARGTGGGGGKTVEFT